MDEDAPNGGVQSMTVAEQIAQLQNAICVQQEQLANAAAEIIRLQQQ